MRLILISLCLAAACLAETRMSVRDLIAFLDSAKEQKQADREIAQFLRDVKLSDRLDDQTIEDLQGKGEVGPKTMVQLKLLRDSSSSLRVPPPPPPPPAVIPSAPPPDSETQGKIIAETRQRSLDYTKSLPNFICSQITKRYADSTFSGHWTLLDEVNVRLSYFEQHEDYKVVFVNNKPTNIAYEKLGGTVSSGEFGSVLKELFLPETQARFEWDHWGTLRGRRVFVFSYVVPQETSQWHIQYEHTDDIVPSYHGMVFIDKDSNMVLRVTQIADGIPPAYPVQSVQMTLDYGFAKINDTEFLLPISSSNESRLGRYMSKNVVEFRLYHRFGADEIIKYDDTAGAAAPDEKTAPHKK